MSQEEEQVPASSTCRPLVQDRLAVIAGKKLHCHYWLPCQPSKPIRALVIVIHGLAEHLAVYDELAQRLTAENMLAFGHDHLGHGLSDGIRGHVETFNDYVSDVLHHVQLMKEEHPGIPVFAIAHSMGGMILLSAALKEPSAFSGLVLMGPLIRLHRALSSPGVARIGRLLSRIAPQLTVGSLVAGRITSDLVMQERIMADPLVFKRGIRLHWATAMHDCLVEVNSNLGSMSVPFLTLHGELDQLCAVEGSQVLYDTAPVEDKTIKVYPKAQHHLYLEMSVIREEAMKDTVDWIIQRIPT